MQSHDAIVIGLGGVGGAAAFHLAARGLRVLGLERFTPAHDRGSSHGATRILRQAYCEHPDYVPLAQRAVRLWRELEARRGESLYDEIGVLQAGPPDGLVVSGSREAARLHGLEIESLDAGGVRERFPGFVLAEDAEAVFERQAGYLRVEQCVLAHLEEARKLGADLRFETPVRGWRAEGSGVRVETEQGVFSAGRLVIAGGAWAGRLLDGLGVRFEVLRKSLHWFPAESPHYHRDGGCPVFLFEMHDGRVFYGFPQVDEHGVKASAHHGGTPVKDLLSVPREVFPEERAAVQEFLAAHLPGVSREASGHAVCLYTMSPDRHFVVDRHPERPQAVFAAGLSGHGFKFVPVLGEALADLAMEGKTGLPIGFLNCARPGLH